MFDYMHVQIQARMCTLIAQSACLIYSTE